MGKLKYLKTSVILLVFVVIGILRFISLDLDPPSYNQSGINVTDEPYYCISAVNDYLKNASRLETSLEYSDANILFQHNYLVNRISLEVFGYNFIGLRFGVAFTSMLVILLLYLAITKTIECRFSQKVVILLLIGFDYYLLLISRYQNPMLYSVFWISLVLFVMAFFKSRLPKVVLSSALIFIMIIWVYPYTAFVGLGFACWIVVRSLRERSIRLFLASGLGVLGGAMFLFIAFSLLDKDFLDYYELLDQVAQVRDESNKGFTLFAFAANLLQIPLTNLFRYSPWLLIVIIAGVVPCLQRFNKLTSVEQFAFLCMVCAVFQSIFISSYPFKKWVTIYPFVIVLFFPILLRLLVKPPRKWLMVLIVIGGSLIALYNLRVNSDLEYWSAFAIDYELTPVNMVLQFILYCSIVLVCAGLIIVVMFKSFKGFWIQSLIILVSMMFTFNYLLSNKYMYKTNLIGIQDQLDNTLITGEFSHAFGLYNKGIVSYNPYNYTYGRISESQIQTSFQTYSRLAFIRKNLNENEGSRFKNHFDKMYILEKEGPIQLYLSE